MFKICNGLRVRRKQNLSHFFVCMYVTLHNSSILWQILDFLVLKIKKKICGATKIKRDRTFCP